MGTEKVSPLLMIPRGRIIYETIHLKEVSTRESRFKDLIIVADFSS
jgi:hypothetical protein